MDPTLPFGFVPKTAIHLLGVLSGIADVSDRSSKLHHFLQMLEQEKTKIHAFKRELPFCMRLVEDAIGILKESEEKESPCTCRRGDLLPPVEFIPLKEHESNGPQVQDANKLSKVSSMDKTTWLNSVQLWNTHEYHHNRNHNSVLQGHKEEEKVPSLAEHPSFTVNLTTREEEQAKLQVSSLTTREEEQAKLQVSSGFPLVVHSVKDLQITLHPPPIRKQRRAWSPQLHRRFLDALRKLGGSHAATPRRIRELMQIDGLTNDEVKSHLQKYRLHNKGKNGRAAKDDEKSEPWSGSPQGPLDSGVGTIVDDEEGERSESCAYKNQIFNKLNQNHQP